MHIEPSNKTIKTQLRKDIRHKRASINEEQRKRWDSEVESHLAEYIRQSKPSLLAAYMAFDGEPDLTPTLKQLQNQGLPLALPVVQDAPGKAVITFRLWPQNGALQPNRYGILEPAGTEEVHVTDIDLMLIPLVGWDSGGGRLGMGASFYDRLLQPFTEHDKPMRMGVAYELQRVDQIPGDPWDIRLHSMLTENGLFTFAN